MTSKYPVSGHVLQKEVSLIPVVIDGQTVSVTCYHLVMRGAYVNGPNLGLFALASTAAKNPQLPLVLVGDYVTLNRLGDSVDFTDLKIDLDKRPPNAFGLPPSSIA